MTPGPTPAPPEVLGCDRPAGHPSPRPGLQEALRRVPRPPAGALRTNRRCCSSEAPAMARWSWWLRTSARPVSWCWWFRRATSASAGPRSRRRTAPRSITCATPGARSRRRTRLLPACVSARRAPSSSRIRVLDRRRLRSPALRRRRPRGRRAQRDRRHFQPPRGPARNGRLGHRCRCLRRAAGADDAARPGHGERLARGVGQAASVSSPRYYWAWEITRKGQSTLDAPVTPPVSPLPG